MPKSKSRKKRLPQARAGAPGPRTCQDGRAKRPDVRQQPTDLRARDSRVRGVVLFRAAARVQSHCCAPIPNPPGATRIRTGDDQSSVGRCSPNRVRGGRRRSSEPGAGGRHPPGEGSAADRCRPRKLADARARPTAPRGHDAVEPASYGTRRWSRCCLAAAYAALSCWHCTSSQFSPID